VAIRVRWRQATLFADGSEVKYFAVATNQWDWAGLEAAGMASRKGRIGGDLAGRAEGTN